MRRSGAGRVGRIGIAMQPQDRPCDLPHEYHRTLRNEFHVRYLESLGATPSKANLALVNKHLPIDQCTITTAWKSRGWIADYVYIAPETNVAPAGSSRGGATAPEGKIQHELATLLDQEISEAADAEASRPMDSHLHAPSGGMPFAEAQQHFLYPFKRSHGLANSGRVGSGSGGRSRTGSPRKGAAGSPVRTSPHGADVRGEGSESDTEAEVEGTGGGVGRLTRRNFSTRDLHRFQVYTEEEITLELQPLLQLHTKEIVALQAEFVKDFPFERLRSRVSEEDIRFAIGELSRQRTTRFIGLLALFLYWSMLAEGAGHKVEPKQLSSLYCAVQHYFFTVRERMKKRRTQLLFVLPLLLMLARYSVEAIFRHAYPKWWTTIDARDTLQQMDGTIEKMLDPNAYHSHISCLESTSDAIRLAARDALGVKHRSRQARYFATSSLVSSALPEAQMVSRHRHMAGVSGKPGSQSGAVLPEVTAHLPDDAKQQLSRAALRTTPGGRAATSRRPNVRSDSQPSPSPSPAAPTGMVKSVIKPQVVKPAARKL